ncbi:LysR family transcriptional regulator [Aureimonas frigidaquae]|uniref:LysR family transcriptional regulator n=1 Tax=Aureimonas frigidaquae TaxID=424757 RepID=UPI0009FA9D62|nr:LysR substrate-binding domain-containing protein [Aureimonas frigidaquae]
MTSFSSRLPISTSLKVLLALAERGSTVAAADVVNLSQSAVSKQLTKLEERVGTALFLRDPTGLRLSPAGEIYVRQARLAVKAMEDAALEVARLAGDDHVLRLHTLPIFGDRWLLPRFARFAERHPHVDVQFTSFRTPGQAEPDAAFRYGAPPFSGEHALYVNGQDVRLVGAPSYLAKLDMLGAERWLAASTMLEHPGTPNRWADLRQHATGLDLPERPNHIVEFGFYTLVIRAAIAGQGLALIPRRLIAEELAAGLLREAGGIGFRSPNAYWFTWPSERPARPALRLFHDWLAEEVARDRSPTSPPAPSRPTGAPPQA